MKKIFSILLAMILMTGCAAAGDYHLDIQFVVHQGNEDTAVTAEAVFREHEIQFLSGLFPSYVLVMEYNNADLLQSLAAMAEPSDIFSMPSFRKSLSAFSTDIQAETVTGVFTGDLFDEAHEMTSGDFPLNEIISRLMRITDPGYSPGTDEMQDIAKSVFTGKGLQKLSDIMIQYRVYDHGDYLTLNGVLGDKTIFTLSCDLTEENSVKSVLGYPENGKNYYIVSEFKVISDREISISPAMISDRNKLGYRAIMNNAPVLKENWRIRLSPDRKETEFTGEIVPENGKKPLEISGSISKETKLMLLAKIGFRDWTESWFTLAVTLENTLLNTESLKVVSVDSADDNQGLEFVGEISGNAMAFLTRLMMALPEEYRTELLPLN